MDADKWGKVFVNSTYDAETDEFTMRTRPIIHLVDPLKKSWDVNPNPCTSSPGAGTRAVFFYGQFRRMTPFQGNCIIMDTGQAQTSH